MAIGALALSVPMVLSSAHRVQAAETTATAQLQSCLAASHRLELVILVDTSGSLQDSDPLAQRVTAISSVVDRLVQLNQENKTKTELSIIGFDATASTVLPWMSLTPASLPRVSQTLEGFRHRNTGALTDYIKALRLAWDSIVTERIAHPEGCSAVLWFTDGALDLGPSVSHSQSVKMMCGPNAPVNTLARNGVLTFAVGLGNTAQGGMSATAAEELNSYVTGSANGVTGSCGQSVSGATGAFFKVSQPEYLLFALQSAVDPSMSTTPNMSTACQPTVRCETNVPVEITQAINAWRVTAVSSTSHPLTMRLLSPKSTQALTMAPGTTYTYGGGTFRLAVTKSGVLTVVGKFGDDAVRGKWLITFLANQPISVPYWVGLSTPYRLHVVTPSHIDRMATVTGSIELVNTSNSHRVTDTTVVTPVLQIGSPDTPGASLENVPLTMTSPGKWSFEFTNDLATPSLQIVTNGYISTSPTSAAISVGETVLLPAPLPANYPRLEVESLSPQRFSSSTKQTILVRVVSTNNTVGCIRLTGVSALSGLQDVKVRAKLDGRRGCRAVEPGKSLSDSIQLVAKSNSSQIGHVTVKYLVRGRSTSSWIPVTLNVQVVQDHDINVARSLTLLIALLTSGAALLLAVLYGFNRRFGRFYPHPSELVGYSQEIVVGEKGTIVNTATWQAASVTSRNPGDAGTAVYPNGNSVGLSCTGMYEFRIDRNGITGLFALIFSAIRGGLAGPEGATFLVGQQNQLLGDGVVSGTLRLPSMSIANMWMFTPTEVIQGRTTQGASGEFVDNGPYLKGDLTILRLEDPAFDYHSQLVEAALQQIAEYRQILIQEVQNNSQPEEI